MLLDTFLQVLEHGDHMINSSDTDYIIKLLLTHALTTVSCRSTSKGPEANKGNAKEETIGIVQKGGR